MLRTRVGSQLDVARLSRAVQRPGIDPRVWASLAVVRRVVMDAAEGPFADVLLLPSAEEETARIGAVYAGGGFGLYAPLRVDDEVLVAAPSGDPNEGLVIVQRLWSPGDVPPTRAVAHTSDLVLVVEPGRRLRLDVSGGGQVVLNDGTLEVARRTDPVVVGGTATVADVGGLHVLTALNLAVVITPAGGAPVTVSVPLAPAVLPVVPPAIPNSPPNHPASISGVITAGTSNMVA